MIAMLLIALSGEMGTLKLYPGYITRISCEGRLLLSSVGNDKLVRLEALPKDLGCGVLLKPQGASGRTNLILETTTGTIERVIEIAPQKSVPLSPDLRVLLKGDAT